MNNSIEHLWKPLATTPLLWLFVTLSAYVVGCMFQKACSGSPFVSPVLIAIFLVAVVVLVTGTSYETFFAGAQFVNFLLGPATVALAIPLARNVRLVRENLRSIGLALLAGSFTSIVSGLGIVCLLHGSRRVAVSLAPKAATTPIAVALSQQVGGIPSLTAAFAILGGIIAAAIGEHLLHGLQVRDWRAHGLAAGIAGSGIAAAQVATRNEIGAAFAALGIGLNGLLTAILIPVLIRLLP